MDHPVGAFIHLPDRGEHHDIDDRDGFVTQRDFEYLAAQRWLREHGIATDQEEE